MADVLTGWEEASLVTIGEVLDAMSPATAEDVYLATISHSERCLAAVAATRGGSGATDPVGFALHQFDNQTVSNSGRWHPDVTDFDSGDWTLDLPNGDFASPATNDLYFVQAELWLEITGADECWCDISVSATQWNVDPLSFQLTNPVNEYNANTWVGRTAVILPLGPSCTLRLSANWHPFGISSGDIVSGTYLRAFKYAALPV